jgi:hypothetical protein
LESISQLLSEEPEATDAPIEKPSALPRETKQQNQPSAAVAAAPVVAPTSAATVAQTYVIVLICFSQMNHLIPWSSFGGIVDHPHLLHELLHHHLRYHHHHHQLLSIPNWPY